MTITPLVDTDNPTPTPIESNGVGLLPEEADGSGDIANGNPPKPLGTITDNKNSTNKAVYEIATGGDATTDNANFNIDANTLYYIGANAGDFETAGVKKSFTLKIVRYNEVDATGVKRSPQIFEYIVNLKNLNDNKPTDLVGNVGEATTAIPYIAAGKVGGQLYEMALRVGADGQQITISFVNSVTYGVNIEPQPTGATSTSGTLTGFKITIGSVSYTLIADALSGGSGAHQTTSDSNLDVWEDYLIYATYISTLQGGPSSGNILFAADPVTLTARPTIEVNEGTNGIIANFYSTDADNLQSLTYSLVGTDSDDFTIDAATGKLSFKTPPNFTNPIDANSDNTYEVTVTVSDGKTDHDKTYDLLVVVTE